MRHRIFVGAIAPQIEVTGDEFHHAARVVRVREGEEVEVFDGKGHAAHGRVVAIAKESLRVDVDREIDSRESPLRITLAAAIIQPDKFELVLQKTTELGVAAIIPLVTDRIEVRAERYRGKAERWQKIVFEAVKQSGRALIPALTEPQTFDEVVKNPGLKIIFDADEPEDRGPRPGDLNPTLLVGPEGGWSEREIAIARENGCRFRSLGPRRLRAETAAITAVAAAATRPE
ncbi:MAG TPA: RsmE family RNA methyltransferase [Thermoanaerobaculia bacterium]|nr:RsmE family RNA methyltransferase [Thermoanaerobaculia bacterium]